MNIMHLLAFTGQGFCQALWKMGVTLTHAVGMGMGVHTSKVIQSTEYNPVPP